MWSTHSSLSNFCKWVSNSVVRNRKDPPWPWGIIWWMPPIYKAIKSRNRVDTIIKLLTSIIWTNISLWNQQLDCCRITSLRWADLGWGPGRCFYLFIFTSENTKYRTAQADCFSTKCPSPQEPSISFKRIIMQGLPRWSIAGGAGSILDPTCSGVTKLHTTSEPTRSNEEPVCAARTQHSHNKL